MVMMKMMVKKTKRVFVVVVVEVVIRSEKQF